MARYTTRLPLALTLLAVASAALPSTGCFMLFPEAGVDGESDEVADPQCLDDDCAEIDEADEADEADEDPAAEPPPSDEPADAPVEEPKEPFAHPGAWAGGCEIAIALDGPVRMGFWLDEAGQGIGAVMAEDEQIQGSAWGESEAGESTVEFQIEQNTYMMIVSETDEGTLEGRCEISIPTTTTTSGSSGGFDDPEDVLLCITVILCPFAWDAGSPSTTTTTWDTYYGTITLEPVEE